MMRWCFFFHWFAPGFPKKHEASLLQVPNQIHNHIIIIIIIITGPYLTCTFSPHTEYPDLVKEHTRSH